MAGRILVFSVLSLFLVGSPLFHLARAESISIGSISEKPNKEIKKFLPLAGYLEKQLQPDGVEHVKVVVVKDIYMMAAKIKEGKVDLYIDSPFPVTVVSRISGSKFLLRRWKKGIDEYHSVVFVRKDSGIDCIEKLKGKIIAFEEPFSSSGYFLPKMFMEREGLELVSRRNTLSPVNSNKVGYVFCGEGNTAPWVFKEKVIAGAIDNYTFLKYAEASSENFKVIFKTADVPRHIVSYRGDMDKKIVDRLREILVNMDKSNDGMEVLKEFEKTTKFDEIPHESKILLSKSQQFIDNEFELQ